MDNFTQLGITGIALAILSFTVKYFVSALQDKDKINQEMTNKFVKIAEENTEARIHLSQAIDAMTEATKTSTNSNKTNSDNLSALMLKVIKSNK